MGGGVQTPLSRAGYRTGAVDAALDRIATTAEPDQRQQVFAAPPPSSSPPLARARCIMTTEDARHELYEAARRELGERRAATLMVLMSAMDPDRVATKEDLDNARQTRQLTLTVLAAFLAPSWPRSASWRR